MEIIQLEKTQENVSLVNRCTCCGAIIRISSCEDAISGIVNEKGAFFPVNDIGFKFAWKCPNCKAINALYGDIPASWKGELEETKKDAIDVLRSTIRHCGGIIELNFFPTYWEMRGEGWNKAYNTFQSIVSLEPLVRKYLDEKEIEVIMRIKRLL